MACINCKIKAYKDNMPQTDNNMEKFNEMISGEKLVLVDFFATWCQPCKMMQPVLEEIKDLVGDKLHIVKLDIDKQSDVADHFNIKSVPTLMLFHNGELEWRNSGYTPRSEIMAIVSPLLK